MASCVAHGEWELRFFACPKCFKDGDVSQPIKSDTPRTDALLGALERDDLSWDQAGPKFQILAAQLERELAARPEVAPQFSPQFWCKSQNTVGGEHEGVPCFTQCAGCELEQCKRRVEELESAPGAPRSPQKTSLKGTEHCEAMQAFFDDNRCKWPECKCSHDR